MFKLTVKKIGTAEDITTHGNHGHAAQYLKPKKMDKMKNLSIEKR